MPARGRRRALERGVLESREHRRDVHRVPAVGRPRAPERPVARVVDPRALVVPHDADRRAPRRVGGRIDAAQRALRARGRSRGPRGSGGAGCPRRARSPVPRPGGGRLRERCHAHGVERRERERDERVCAQKWRSGRWMVQNHWTTRVRSPAADVTTAATAPAPRRRPEVSIVVPTYNERGRIAELVETVSGVFRDSGIRGELVVVDDNSPDGTGRSRSSLTDAPADGGAPRGQARARHGGHGGLRGRAGPDRRRDGRGLQPPACGAAGPAAHMRRPAPTWSSGSR